MTSIALEHGPVAPVQTDQPRDDTHRFVSRVALVGAVLGPLVGVRVAGANASLPFVVVGLAFLLVMRAPRSPTFQAALAALAALVLWGGLLVVVGGGVDVLGLVELLGLVTGFLAVWIMGVTLEGDRLRSFLRFARYVHVLALALALLETASGFHLPSAFVEARPDFHGPLLSLNNPNDLSTFFVFLAALLMAETVLYRSVGRRTLAVLLPLDLAMIAVGGARLALIGFAVVVLIYLVFVNRVAVFAHPPERSRTINPIGRLMGLGTIVALGIVAVASTGIGRAFSAIALELETGGSTLMRWRVLLESGRMAAHSTFLGIGPGQFEGWMSGDERRYETWGTIEPHNAGAEFLGQYGLAGVAFLVAIGALVVGGSLGRSGATRSLRAVCVIMFVATVTVSVAASGFIETPLHWVYVGVALAISAHIRARSRAIR